MIDNLDASFKIRDSLDSDIEHVSDDGTDNPETIDNLDASFKIRDSLDSDIEDDITNIVSDTEEAKDSNTEKDSDRDKNLDTEREDNLAKKAKQVPSSASNKKKMLLVQGNFNKLLKLSDRLTMKFQWIFFVNDILKSM